MAKGEALSRLLRKYAENTKQNIDKATEEQALEMGRDIETGWPVAEVDGGYSRASISAPERVAYAWHRISISANYARVIEYGGYRGVGPKTSQQAATILPGGIAVNGGIYPTQRPSAPVRRALSKRKVLLEEALRKAAARKYANA